VRALVLALALTGCVAAPGTIDTIVGTGEAGPGDEDVHATAARLYLPMDVRFGPDGAAWVDDWNNNRFRRIDPETGRITTLIGSGRTGDGPDGPVLETGLNHCTDIAFEPGGTVLLADWHNSRIKRVDLAAGTVQALWGTSERGFVGDGDPVEDAVFSLPVSIVFDSQGRLVIADQGNNRVRRVEGGQILTIVGTGVGTAEPAAGEAPERCIGATSIGVLDCFSGDGGPATEATLNNTLGQSGVPMGRVDLDASDTLFIADTKNHVVRRVDDATGSIVTIAGIGSVLGADGDGGPAIEGTLNAPHDVAVAEDGTVYIADTDNHCVRRIDPDGTLGTAAGVCGTVGYEGDGGAPEEALLNTPYGVTVAPDGSVWVSDTYNHVVRRFEPYR
jgi:sugar lactone lactonase YvrE